MLDNFLDLRTTNVLLDRIAEALERLAGPSLPIELPHTPRIRGKEALITYGNEEQSWLKQEATQAAHSQGLSPTEEETLVLKILANENGLPEEEL